MSKRTKARMPARTRPGSEKGPTTGSSAAAFCFFLFVSAGAFAQTFIQPDETLPGFRPQNVLEMHGLDNVSPFNGDVGIVLPLSPDYTLSSAMDWQLKAFYSAKLWRMDAGVCSNDPTVRHAYLRGDPTIGVGWTLNPGWVGQYVVSGEIHTGYFGPDGGTHEGGTDGSHIRIQSQGTPTITSYTVEFPDGSRQTFGYAFTAPRPTVGTSVDFTENSWPPGTSRRFGLTKIEDAFRNVVLTVSYDTTHLWEVSSISLPTLGQTVTFTWTDSPPINGVTWRVLDHIDFPVFGSATRRVIFGGYAAATFARSNYDNSSGSGVCNFPSGGIAVPSLGSITFSDTATPVSFSYPYTMTYYTAPSGGTQPVQQQGALQKIVLPTGGAINYTYNITAGRCQVPQCSPEGAAPAPPPLLVQGSNSGESQNFLDKSIAVATRCESTTSSTCTATTTYTRTQYTIQCLQLCNGYDWNPSKVVRRVDVVAPGNDSGGTSSYLTRYYFHAASFVDTSYEDGGIELERRYYTDGTATTIARDIVNCWSPVPNTNSAGGGCGYHPGTSDTTALFASTYFVLPPKQAEVTWYGAVPSGDGSTCPTSTTPCKASTHGPMATDYDANAQQFRTTTSCSGSLTSGGPTFPGCNTSLLTSGGPTHTSFTHWTPYIDSTHWYLNLFDEKDETENGATVYHGFEFDTTYADPTNGGRVMPGFPRGSWTNGSPSDPNNGLRLECRYPDASGNGKWQFSATFPGSSLTGFSGPPYHSLCSSTIYANLPAAVLGTNGDAFGHVQTFAHPGLLGSATWINGGSSNAPNSIGWFDFNVARDLDVGSHTGSGLIASSTDSAGVATSYGYDALGRLTSVSPSAVYPTFACYDLATRTTTYRAPGAVACPTVGFSGSIQTWQQYLYDGLGRLSREIRGIPTNAGSYAARTHSYDGAGHKTFDSEWAGCSVPASDCTAVNPGGTRYSSFDPFGRPQSVVRADGSTVGTSYSDGTILFSDTKKAVTVNNINGLCNGTCSGGTPATTTYAYDVYGRLTKVTEPTGDPTSYAYDANGKLTNVTQTAQTRTFGYTSYGFLRTETTPEKGTVDSSGKLANGSLKIGSLGNVEERTEAFGSAHPKTHDYAYDPAGRVLTETVNGVRYVMNCYDGSPTKPLCPDGTTANFSGGNNPVGNLTRRVGSNPLVSPFPTVQEDYNYSGLGGRLSTLSTTVSGGIGQVDETWLYNGLGLVAHQSRPRLSNGTQTPLVLSTVYTGGLPTSLYLNGLPVVTGVDYAASGALRDYTTGLFVGKTVKTTILPDSTGMPRPASISTSGASASSLGNYVYDGVGNIDCLTTGASCITGQIDTFTYDNRSRLTQATLSGSGTQNYTYDLYGNLLSKGATTFCTGGSCANNKMPSPYFYDERGNLTNSPGENYGYDDLNRVVSSSSGWSYVHNGSGERVVRIPPTGSWTYTFRDEADRVASELIPNSAPPPVSVASIDNVFLGSQVVASYANGSVPGNDHVWAFYSSDHLATPRFLTNINGAVFDTRKYWPYGEQVAGTSLLGHVRFAAMERDSEAGTNNDRYFDHARHHESGLGRFLSADKLPGFEEEPQSWNLYTYALTNPPKYRDPSGMEVVCNESNTNCSVSVSASNTVSRGTFAFLNRDFARTLGRAADDLTFNLLVKPYFSLVSGSNNSYRQLGLDLVNIGLNVSGPLFKGLPVGLAIERIAGRVAPKLEELSAHVLGAMEKRGWTKEMIREAFEAGPVEAAVDKTVSPFGNATRYVHPTTGQSVVINNSTGNVVHVGGPGFRY